MRSYASLPPSKPCPSWPGRAVRRLPSRIHRGAPAPTRSKASPRASADAAAKDPAALWRSIRSSPSSITKSASTTSIKRSGAAGAGASRVASKTVAAKLSARSWAMKRKAFEPPGKESRSNVPVESSSGPRMRTVDAVAATAVSGVSRNEIAA